MSDADEAYEEAQRRIAEAKAHRGQNLHLSGLEALDRLPEEIGALTDLTGLTLHNTQVTDLAPLASLSALKLLTLSNTQVTDLAPLAGLSALTRLFLDNTPVTDLAPLAGLSALTQLTLNNTQVTDLAPLASLSALALLTLANTPVTDLAPLASLTDLTQLNLHNTQVTDLAPLASLSTLTRLNLNYTPVTDLVPLLALRRFAEDPDRPGLTFRGCGATKADPHLREISEIENNAARARALFDYLDPDWKTRGEAEPVDDPLAPIEIDNDRIEIAASHPDEAERDDALKRALHERLRAKAEDLARLAGNQFPRLAARARGLHQKLDRDFEELDMVQLHFDVEDLADLYERRDERQGEDVLTPDVVDALADVARDGPGLTLDNADVEKLEERKRRFAANPPGPKVQEAHEEMSRAIAGDEAVFGERLRALEDQMEGRVALPSTGVLQEAVHRNVLLRIGRVAVGSVNLAAAGVTLWPWVSDQWPLLVELSQNYGPAFARWFIASMSRVPELAALFANVETGLIPRRPKK